MRGQASALRPAVGHALLIFAVAVACGFVANTVSPRRIPWSEDWGNYIESKALREGVLLVTTSRAKELAAQHACIILDARPAADYKAGRIPGAVSLPYDNVEEELAHVQVLLSPSQPIMTYCSGKQCDESFLLTLYLKKAGFTNIVLYAGGFDQWRAEGLPTEGGQP
ncbi:MAG TPA: rhodanese-like domain-containing protein [Kiritimatiellia bacterium]|nr:rhodanese-like domain-containing protein [Kiritimatiellia bacterium]